jgi:hypothetical protein
MRAAPPVDAALGAGRPERMLITLLHGLAGGLLAAWMALPLWQVSTMSGMLAAAAVMAGFGHWLARRALPPAADRLRWDGQAWNWVAGAQSQPMQQLVVALDLGIWVLLQLHPVHGRPAWRVASVRGAEGQWHGLRVALAAHAGLAADAGAAP